ncbi:MAG: hypothetical protein KDG51_19405, partial [Calditrichaeota bacterium]|nr:hypothetical protein [Calditrichota bacterium]
APFPEKGAGLDTDHRHTENASTFCNLHSARLPRRSDPALRPAANIGKSGVTFLAQHLPRWEIFDKLAV